jgi:hypothetical protein
VRLTVALLVTVCIGWQATRSTAASAPVYTLSNPRVNITPSPNFLNDGSCTGGPGAWTCTNPCVTTGPGLTDLFHRRRGRIAIDKLGVLPGYLGVTIHDGWSPYRAYESVTHALCNAHHLRELQAVFEEGQSWADEMSELLCAAHQEVRAAKEAQKPSLSPRRLISTTRRYDQLIEAGHAANPPPIRSGKRGRP